MGANLSSHSAAFCPGPAICRYPRCCFLAARGVAGDRKPFGAWWSRNQSVLRKSRVRLSHVPSARMLQPPGLCTVQTPSYNASAQFVAKEAEPWNSYKLCGNADPPRGPAKNSSLSVTPDRQASRWAALIGPPAVGCIWHDRHHHDVARPLIFEDDD